MKKVLLLLSIPFILFSCAKNDSARPVDQQPELLPKQAVALSVSDFIQTQVAMDAKGADLAKISKLYYAVYDSTGAYINSITQDSASVGFGNVKDSLRPGTYTVVMAAVEAGLSFNVKDWDGVPYSLSQAHLYANLLGARGVDNLKQVFYKKFTIKVNQGVNAGIQNINLERIVGKLELNLPDAHNVLNNNIYILIQPALTRFDLEAGKAAPADTFMQHNLAKTSTGVYEDFFFGSDNTYKLTIRYANPDGSMSVKIVENFKVTTNQKTIINGYLFSTSPNASTLKVQMNQSWSNDSTIVNF